MFDVLINLLLTGLFLNARVDSQPTLAENQISLAAARELEKQAPQKDPASISQGVALTAKSVLAIDEEFGKILYEKNSQEVRSIASLTKLMTALVFVESNPDWESAIKIKADDQRPGGIAYFLPGEEARLADVFKAMLVASANEAAVVLARAGGLDENQFVQKMNEKAKALGMANTSFVDPAGLSPDNRSTAVDLMILFRAALKNSRIYQAVSEKEFSFSVLNKNLTRRVKTTNLLLEHWFGLEQKYEVLAGKTGFLEAAGYCFVSQSSDALGHKILTVVLGSGSLDDRFNDTKSLAFWLFNNYLWPR